MNPEINPRLAALNHIAETNHWPAGISEELKGEILHQGFAHTVDHLVLLTSLGELEVDEAGGSGQFYFKPVKEVTDEHCSFIEDTDPEDPDAVWGVYVRVDGVTQHLLDFATREEAEKAALTGEIEPVSDGYPNPNPRAGYTQLEIHTTRFYHRPGADAPAREIIDAPEALLAEDAGPILFTVYGRRQDGEADEIADRFTYYEALTLIENLLGPDSIYSEGEPQDQDDAASTESLPYHIVFSSNGELHIDATGKVLEMKPCDVETQDQWERVESFDVAEFLNCWPGPLPAHIDILDIGVHWKDGSYTPAEPDFRAEALFSVGRGPEPKATVAAPVGTLIAQAE